jgi:fimbrial isopeptide formation D2 family protein/uncharacterized repeat protein (TIGR01451 family)
LLGRNEISVAKAAGVPQQTGEFTFEVPYSVVVANVLPAGSPTVYNVKAQDNLSRTYPTATSISVKALTAPVASGGATCTAATAAYNGTTNNNLLAGTDDLAPGQGCTVTFTAVLDFSANGVPTVTQNNTVYASGMGADVTPNAGYTVPNDPSLTPVEPVGATTVDLSTTGAKTTGPAGTTPANPVPVSGDKPTPTPTDLVPQKLDVIKVVGVPNQTGAASYNIPYTLVLKNTGTQPTPNVQVMENFKRTFGATQSFAMSTPASVVGGFTAPATAAPVCTVAAPVFNGTSQQALLAGTNALLPGQYCVISYVVNVAWANAQSVPTVAQNNTVYAAANLNPQVPGGANVPTVPDAATSVPTYPTTTTTKDQSSNVVPTTPGLPGAPVLITDLPNPTNPVDPAAPVSPTPVTLVPASIDVVKQLNGAVVFVDGQTFDVPYVVTIANTGAVAAYNVQASEYLRATFSLSNGALPSLTNGAGSVGATDAAVIGLSKSAVTGNCTVATNFNGNSASGLLAGTDTFAAGDRCTVKFTVRVKYASPADVPSGTPQDNSVYASTTPSGAPTNPGYTYTPVTTPRSPTNPSPLPAPTAPANAVAIDVSTDASTPPANGGAKDTPKPTPVTLSSGPDVVINKTHTPSVFTVDNIGTYTLTAGNLGYLPTSGSYTVTDPLPTGMTVNAVPTGTGWNCSATVVGSNMVSCVSTEVIAAPTGNAVPRVPNYSANPITLKVNVTKAACSGANADGQCASVTNIAAINGGGELNIPLYTGNNTYPDPTPIQEAATLSGAVWSDVNHDRKLDAGELAVGGMIVEVLDASGQVVKTVTSNPTTATGALGSPSGPGGYSVAGLVPGQPYTVRFRDPGTSGSNGVVYGVPTVDHSVAKPTTVGTTGGSTSTGTSMITSPSELTVMLKAGQNLSNQSLPLDPSGVIYDSVTRAPIAGATVTISGPPGFDPTKDLVGASGTNSGYNVSGPTASMSSGGLNSPLPGAYQFLLNPSAPAGVYTIKVTAPGYTSFVAGTITAASASAIIPAATQATAKPTVNGTVDANGVFTPKAAAGTMNASANVDGVTGNPPPTGSTDTTYFLGLNLTPNGGVGVVNNHIPMDPASQPKLLISKVGDKSSAEIGDSVRYTLTVKRVDTATYTLPVSQIVDRLPAGFRYIDGTTQINGVSVKDAANVSGVPGPVLTFNTGAIAANGTVTVTYRVRLAVGSQQGTGINRATATVGVNVNCAVSGALCSNEAQYKVKVTGGVLGTQACIVGKVYMDCNNNHMQDSAELPIPGVRMYMQDGTSITSDVEGKYSLCDLDPKLNVLVLDQTTLPRGSVMTTSGSRNAGDAMSLFLDLKNGDMQRADFVETSCYDGVIKQVKARQVRDDAKQRMIKPSEENTLKNRTIDFESKPLNIVTPFVAR